MREIKGKKIKMIEKGEKMDEMEELYKKRIEESIIGMGEIV